MNACLPHNFTILKQKSYSGCQRILFLVLKSFSLLKLSIPSESIHSYSFCLFSNHAFSYTNFFGIKIKSLLTKLVYFWFKIWICSSQARSMTNNGIIHGLIIRNNLLICVMSKWMRTLCAMLYKQCNGV